jgi:FKBP-type peptidyl-prolyl cis-trans isomerase
LVTYLSHIPQVVGTGNEVAEGKTVQFTWVMRRSNGYFVDSNVDFDPFIYKVGNLKKAMKGIDDGIRGMKQGGVRRLNIPAKLAFLPGGVADDAPGPIPSGTFTRV